MESLRERLAHTVLMWQQSGYPALLERFCVAHGVEFQGTKRPKGMRKLQAKMCFRNSVRMFGQDGVKYYEGFAMSRDIQFPFLHAWNTVDGDIVDLTLPEPHRYEYVGLDLSKYVWRELAKNQVYGLLDPGVINIDLLKEIDEPLVTTALRTRLLHSGRPEESRTDD